MNANVKMLSRKNWSMEDGITREIEFLIQHNDFQIYRDRDSLQKFSIKSKQGVKEYPEWAKIFFHDIVYDMDGKIITLKFYVYNDDACTLWKGEYGMSIPEVKFLSKNYSMIIDPDSRNEAYKIKYNGECHSYPEGTMLKFFDVVKNEDGEIESLRFHVLLQEEVVRSADEEKTPEMEWFIRSYGFFYDCDAMVYRLINDGEIQEYPRDIRIAFHSREYNEDGSMFKAKWSIQQKNWRPIGPISRMKIPRH